MATTKKQFKQFSQKVFMKLNGGVQEYGIILRQKFHQLHNVQQGDEVQLRETSEYDTEYAYDGGWCKLRPGRPI